jgi:hypothetical protein
MSPQTLKKEDGWLFCEVLGMDMSGEEENKILDQLTEMKDEFLSPKDFIKSVLAMIEEEEDKDKKLIIMANAGKVIGFFSR